MLRYLRTVNSIDGFKIRHIKDGESCELSHTPIMVADDGNVMLLSFKDLEELDDEAINLVTYLEIALVMVTNMNKERRDSNYIEVIASLSDAITHLERIKTSPIKKAVEKRR